MISFSVFLLNSCKENNVEPANSDEENDILSGGDLTTFADGSTAFSLPAPNLSPETLAKHLRGDLQFEQSFVKSPSKINSGLGPLFNSNSCINCHVSDGRGQGGTNEAMLFRISSEGENEFGGPKPISTYGTQLQNKAIVGYQPEGNVTINYSEIEGTYPDGTSYSLRNPDYILNGNLGNDVLLSPRVAPSVFGLGLLEAVSDENIIAMSDEYDSNQDGISGKVNYVWNVKDKRNEVGKFGWKANAPNLLQQTAAAYNQDIGITSPYFPLESCYGSNNCDTLNDDPEISQDILNDVVLYVQTLAVPARRNYNNADVKLGKSLFNQLGCNSCHVTKLETGTHSELVELSNQTIHPYTDLLLHDMGKGLADNRPDFKAAGSEWKTPALWGIGLIEIVNGHSSFLHDGRARSLEEAILWHDGEGKQSKDKFMNLNITERKALIKFLKSL